MQKVISTFDAARRADEPAATALADMRPFMPADACNGYWHGKPGLELIEAALA